MPGGSENTVKLERSLVRGVLPPWGFGIHGGKDFGHSLTVMRVSWLSNRELTAQSEVGVRICPPPTCTI
jgi:hypothetical protein